MGNPRGLWLLVEGIHAEIWVVSETRIHIKIQGKFPKTIKCFISTQNDIKSSLWYFHITGTLPMSWNCILKFLREARGKIPRGNIPGIPQGKEAEISTSKILLQFPWISAGKSWGNFRRDDSLEFSHKSAWKSGGRGWLSRWVDKLYNIEKFFYLELTGVVFAPNRNALRFELYRHNVHILT